MQPISGKQWLEMIYSSSTIFGNNYIVAIVMVVVFDIMVIIDVSSFWLCVLL